MADIHKTKGKSQQKQKKTDALQNDKIHFSHNNFFTAFFDEKEVVESFLKEYAPAEITKELNFNSLQVQKRSFIDKKLRSHFSDILYTIRFKQKLSYVYLLFEHKSKPWELSSFQLLKYMVQIWDMHLKQHKKKEVKSLPPIIPMVIYHGESQWKARTDFLTLFDIPESLEKYIPNFQFELYDISHTSDKEIKGTVLLKILLMTLKYIFQPELNHKVKDIFQLLSDLDDKSRGIEYLEILLRYLSNSTEYVKEEILKESVMAILDQGGELMPTLAQKWMQEGMQEGMENGKKENAREVAKRMLNDDFPIEKIIKYTGLTEKEVKELLN